MPPPGANTRFSRTLRNALSHNVLRFSAVCYRLSCAAERAFSPCGKARFMSRYGTSGTAIRAIWQCGKAFFVLRRHIFPRPSALKRLPGTHFPALYPHILRPVRSSFPISRCQYFLLLKTYKYAFLHLLTLSPPHSLTSSLFPFYLFNFYPFTFKNSFFPLPFYLFTLLIFIFSPSCSFSLIVKKYLYSVIFIPIYLSCFHKSINFAEVLVEIRHVPPDMEVLLYC